MHHFVDYVPEIPFTAFKMNNFYLGQGVPPDMINPSVDMLSWIKRSYSLSKSLLGLNNTVITFMNNIV